MSSAYWPVRLPSLSAVVSSLWLMLGAARKSPPRPASAGSSAARLSAALSASGRIDSQRGDVERVGDRRAAGFVPAARDLLVRDGAERLARVG